MPAKPRLLLLDAGAVMAAFACGAWPQLCKAYEIVVPSIVIDEVQFYKDASGSRHEIDLRFEMHEGRVLCYEATESEFKYALGVLHPELRDRIHAGEQEAISYLLTREDEDIAFVSGDGAAIEAVAALGHSTRAISLRSALQKIGITKKLQHQFCDEFLREKTRLGEVRRMQGRSSPS